MAEKKFGELYRNVRICIDSYDSGVMTGRMCRAGADCEAFHSLTQLLVRMEDLMNEANFPQSFTARRSFAPITEAKPDAAETAESGKLATFSVRVMFRQHASWQGSVTWIEGSGEQTFRSVLELILLMDSALGGCWEETA